MIKVLKETPITWNGQTRMEQLVIDLEAGDYDPCGRCMFDDCNCEYECMAPCHIVHGCTDNALAYFRLTALCAKED